MKVWDCFPFFHEFTQLDIRVRELSPVVHKHVLVEATKTHSGMQKPLYFSERAHEYRDWPIECLMTDLPDARDPWVRERYQRDCLMQALSQVDEEDLILISDADEIPSADAVRKAMAMLSPEKVGVCEQVHYYYWLDCRADYEKWYGTRVLRKGLLTQPSALRYVAAPRPGEVVLSSAGWHFAWLGGKEAIQEKIRAFAHQELNHAGLLEDRYILSCIMDGWTAHDRRKLVFCDVDETYPRYVRENLERLEPYLHRKGVRGESRSRGHTRAGAG